MSLTSNLFLEAIAKEEREIGEPDTRSEDKILSTGDPTTFTYLNDKWGEAVKKLVVVAIDDSNPQKFGVMIADFDVTGHSGSDTAANMAPQYWSQVSSKIKKFVTPDGQPFQRYKAKGIITRKTGLDLDLTAITGKKNCVIVFMFNDRKIGFESDTFFLHLGAGGRPGMGQFARDALYRYGNANHILRRAVFLDRGRHAIMSYCTAETSSDSSKYSDAFALGATISDMSRGADFSTDIIIDPQIKNDG